MMHRTIRTRLLSVLVFACALALSALFFSFTAHAQVCGGEQCSASEVCCSSRDGVDRADTFMLCVSESQCTAMSGVVVSPPAGAAGEGEDCSARTCQSGLTCVRDISVTPERSLCEDLSNTPDETDVSDTQVTPVRPPMEGGSPSTGGVSRGSGLKNVLNAGTIDQLVVLILDALVYLGTILLILMLVWTGFLFVRAQGAQEQLTKAKDALFWTVVGGLVLLGASALSLVLQATIQSL